MSENDDPFYRMRQQESPTLGIEPEEIFKDYNEEDLSVFVNEFYMVFNLSQSLDEDYNQGDSNRTQKNIKRFKNLIKDWNKKYRDILLEFLADGLQCRLIISFDEKLDGIVKIIKRMKRFVEIRSYTARRLNTVFSEQGRRGENTLTFETDGRTVKMIYSKQDMLKPESPEFRICSYYALKNGFDKTIDIIEKYKEAFSFGSESTETYGWNSRWNVRFLR